MRDMGWRRSEPLFEPTNENIDVKSNLNVGSSLLSSSQKITVN